MHARAATQFVQMASRYPCDVLVEKDGQEVNGKSIMGVLL
ncbi:MAG: HPr family phosphocarrier protein, partial [Deltaproteobacteria bacterium]|nr:HPr family phosphocarrier protein [Deltaproteobacteria bacterium]